MTDASYVQRRGEVEEYFDRTALDAWKKFASDEPLSGIRATVRAGRERMRGVLLGMLPEDLRGARVLDAGCGAGAMALALAERGAEVLAVDLSPEIVRFAAEGAVGKPGAERIRFEAGDMLGAGHGGFDAVVAMDSLIHYQPDDAARAVSLLAERTGGCLAFTCAPRTPLLSAMHLAGKLFPRADRSPRIVPVRPARLASAIEDRIGSAGWTVCAGERVDSRFYISQAMEARAA